MYPVSNAYKSAIRRPGLITTVRGTCGMEPFTDENILNGSFSITGQCSGNDQVSIGQVYITQLAITLRGLNINRYTCRGLEIIPFFQLKTDDGIEEVKLGLFTISDAKYTAAGMVLKAYDNMAKFDKTCSVGAASGTPFQLATMACSACGVTLATTSAEFSAFANGSEQLTLYAMTNDIETWRDFISWVAQSCACNVIADRDGDIRFVPYHSTVDDVLDTNHRFLGAEFSDFVTYYTGIYLQNIEGQEMEYYNIDPDDGLTYNLGKNPFFQYGLDITRAQYCLAVLNEMQSIRYVPFKIQTIDDPSYDLMDVLSLPGGLGDGDRLFCITKFTWHYHDKLTIQGVGSDPAMMTAKSKVEKELSGILSKVDEDTVQFYRFTNAEDFWIRDGQTAEIIRIAFVTKKDAHVDFRAELKFESDTTKVVHTDTYDLNDTIITVTYWLNDEEVFYYPAGTFPDDIFLEHLMYWWFASKNVISDFVVTLTANGGDVKIAAGDLKAEMYGEGLVGEKEDTNPVFRDDVPGLGFDMFGVFTEGVGTSLKTPASGSESDTVQSLTFIGGFDTFTDDVDGITGVGYTPHLSGEYLRVCTVPVDGNYWKATENGQYIQTINIYSATGFYSTTGGMLSYQISIDDGVTWGSWDGSEITEGDEMTYAIIHAIEAWPSKMMVKILFDNAETLGSFIVEGGRITQ